jgi:hypothetical protein
MAPVSMSVSQLRCACIDDEWRAAWMAGKNPSTWDFPPVGTVPVYGTHFHKLARKVTRQLREDPGADSDDVDALLGRVYAAGGSAKLEQLLTEGMVDSAAQLSTAFHAFCSRLVELRGRNEPRRLYRDIFLAEEYALTDVALVTSAGNLFVSGTIDSLRLHASGDIEVVDYKLSTGTQLAKEVIQIALYRALLLAGDPGLRVRGVLEYFLPGLAVTEVSAAELDGAFADVVAPILAELVRSRRWASTRPTDRDLESTAVTVSSATRHENQRPADWANGPPAPFAPTGRLRLGKAQGILQGEVDLDLDLLRRHSAVLGGTGSGKTTLALNIVEQVLERGVSVLLVDRKGDLARYADPAAWDVRDTPERTARRMRLRERLDIALFTPGHRGGRPLKLPLVPSVDGLDGEDQNQLFRNSAHSLGAMLGLKHGAGDEAKRALLLHAIQLLSQHSAGASVADVAAFLEGDDPDFRALVGSLDKERPKLALRLRAFETMNQALLANEGEPLDVESLLAVGQHARAGKTRLSILSTRFFDSDDATLFWVAQLLGELNRFVARRPAPALQGLVMFDEADMYLPATRQPPTKAPMESLLKRARSAGLGVMLATQSPGDLDYRCRENVLTWLIGRIKEPRALDKLKPLASGAGVDASATFPKQAVGQFHLITDNRARAFQSDRSLMDTEQLSERQILTLAQGGSGRIARAPA